MKLISRIALRLSLALLPLMALWGVLFYFTMVDEINDEADDALEDYSELIVKRMLAGRELPKPNNGSNNSYSIVPIGAPEAAVRPHIDYYDAEVYIPEKEETGAGPRIDNDFPGCRRRLLRIEGRHPPPSRRTTCCGRSSIGWSSSTCCCC